MLGYFILTKFSEKVNKIKNLNLRFFGNTVGLQFITTTVNFFLSILILTLYFPLEIYLLILVVQLIPVLFLFIWFYSIGADSFRELVIQELIQTNLANEEVISKIRKYNIFQIILGILIYVIIGIIYFGIDVEPAKQTVYIIAALFIMGSSLVIVRILIAIPNALSPKITRDVRKDYVFMIAIGIYQLSFVTLFVLWVFGVGFFDVIFLIYGIPIYWFYLVLLISLGLFLITTVLYSIGEKRRNKIEAKFYEERNETLDKIINTIDIDKINETKEGLEDLIKFLIEKKANLESSYQKELNILLNNDYLYFLENVLDNIRTEKNKDTPSKDIIQNVISIMKVYTVDHINFFDTMVENLRVKIDYMNQKAEVESKEKLMEFKGQLQKDKKNNEKHIQGINNRSTFNLRNNSLFGIIWTFGTAMIGIPLSDVLQMVASVLT